MMLPNWGLSNSFSADTPRPRNPYWSNQEKWRLDAVKKDNGQPPLTFENSLKFKEYDDADGVLQRPNIDVSKIKEEAAPSPPPSPDPKNKTEPKM